MYSFIKITLFLLILKYAVIQIESANSPVIRILNGNIQGTIAKSRDGRQYYKFLGIPYAKPPIGRLRFQPPKPAKDWVGTLFAKQHRPYCISHEFFYLDWTLGRESCLFLNVMTPAQSLKQSNGTSRYPVIVFIHGGLFSGGTSYNYRGKFFMDENVVLVTIQYRVGIFGFLSTDDGVIKGNMGLKDQVMALKWVQNNIEFFGGDPNQVMIMGQSAGGTSVHHLMLSPLAKGLFHRAVSLSGDSLFETYPFNRNITQQMEYMAEFFQCPLGSSKEFAKCMQTVPVNKLATLRIVSKDMDYINHPGYFTPVVEPESPDAFFTDTPISILTSGNTASKVPWMTGFNDNEGLLILGKVLQFPQTQKLLKDKRFFDAAARLFLFYDNKIKPDAAEAIRKKYFGNRTLDVNGDEAIMILSTMITDKLYMRSSVETALLQSKVSPVYMYYYTYHAFLSTFTFLRQAKPKFGIITNSLNTGRHFVRDMQKKILSRRSKHYHHYGASHGDELFQLFDFSRFTEIFTNTFELEMSRLLIRTIVDFSHADKPVRFNTLPWPPIKSNETLQIMNFNVGEPKILKDPFTEKLKFWNELNLPRPYKY